ncbi:hypothetical protein T4C_5925 [Trichinella pseudospiralis]|uniref:Uncharacterized protein n=1 Tax=Trichinella pseudospiralis TaxID=6337 RepID=A0A0V1JME7_TRIPS|nr:hypothetical protein T4C_5925 [Trichinella pseudospiralis]
MVHTYMEKLMKQKKVKARMTPSKSWTIHRLKRDEKRHAEGVEWQRCETFSEVHYSVKLLRKGVSELLRSKVNEAKKGENANDTMQITDGI